MAGLLESALLWEVLGLQAMIIKQCLDVIMNSRSEHVQVSTPWQSQIC